MFLLADAAGPFSKLSFHQKLNGFVIICWAHCITPLNHCKQLGRWGFYIQKDCHLAGKATLSFRFFIQLDLRFKALI